MTTLLALDPGKATGWSLWFYSNTEPLLHLRHGTIEDGLEGFIHWWDEQGSIADEVVAETFRLDGRTQRPDVTPLKIEGALSTFHPGWIGQPNVMKTHVDDLTLKRIDLWWKGRGHDRDSARHALALMKVRRHVPTLRRYWPPRES